MRVAASGQLHLLFDFSILTVADTGQKFDVQVANPVVKILLPKMNYAPEERWEVIRQAYRGLFNLASLALFEKYRDFIDIYAEVQEEERDSIYREIQQHQETVMIAQLLKEEGIQTGIQTGNLKLLSRQLAKKYRHSSEEVAILLQGLSAEDFLELGEYMLDCEAFDDIEQWIALRKQNKADVSPLNREPVG